MIVDPALNRLLNELCAGVEQLLLSGLTAASAATIERLDVSFKEASRMKLLRLGSTLRIANEEISRFTAGSPQFSAKRFTFFLSRAWVLAQSMLRAIAASDEETLRSLNAMPVAQPVEKLQVVMLGVAKRVVPGAFASFDFRLRAIGSAGVITDRMPLLWSCVFPLRKDLDLPSEAFLHLPQKQKFKPSLFLEQKIVEITHCAMSPQPTSTARLTMTDNSTVAVGAKFDDWASLFCWDRDAAAARLVQHQPTPLDLEIELQEEVILSEWQPGERIVTDQGYDQQPLTAQGVTFAARLDQGLSGTPLTERMNKLTALKRRPQLYGLAHYEACQIVFQPLSMLGKSGLEYLTVSQNKISQAELVKAMKFV